jgi:hypothetical protein
MRGGSHHDPGGESYKPAPKLPGRRRPKGQEWAGTLGKKNASESSEAPFRNPLISLGIQGFEPSEVHFTDFAKRNQ